MTRLAARRHVLGCYELLRVATMPSLCESCANRREVRTARSHFLLCELALADPDYPKYPPQPIAWCAGYRREDEVKQDTATDQPGQDA